MKKLGMRILVTYFALAILFTGTLVAAFSIPGRCIEDNVRHSVHQVTDDGHMFTAHVGPLQPFKLGVFSDCLILGIAYCADSDHPLQAAMSDRFVIIDGSPVAGAKQMLDSSPGDCGQTVIYSRYWHGNQVVLRPLLCLTDLHGVRVINAVLLCILWLSLLVLLWKRIDCASALIVMCSLAAVMIPSVPVCLNFVPTFYIALVASLAILLWRPAISSEGNSILLFFVIGAVTTFFDLLTTPLIAWAIPLVVYMLYCRPDHPSRKLVRLSTAWLVGYALLWATKWLLSALITGYDTFGDAFGAVTQRTVGIDEGEYMFWCLKHTCLALVAIVIVVMAAVALFGKSWHTVRRNGWMLLVALAGSVWALVLLEHTWHHLHFTWRTFVVLLIGIALFMRHTLDIRHPLSLFKKHQ